MMTQSKNWLTKSVVAGGLLGLAMGAQAASVEVYGSIELIYLNQETAVVDPVTTLSSVESVNKLVDRDTTLGFQGEDRINDSLTGFYRIEFEVPGDEKDGIPETDEVFFGLKGDWGRVQVGSWDGVYEDFVADKTDVLEYDGLSKFEDYRTGEVGDAIAYMSPSFGGFEFAAQTFVKGDSQPTGGSNALQLVVGYEVDNYAIHAGYDDNGLNKDADGTFGVSGSVDFSPVSVALKYEEVGDQDTTDNTDDSLSAIALAGEYDYGRGSVILVAQQLDPAVGDGRTELGGNINYSIADNFFVYAEHTGYDKASGVDDYTGVGVVYEF